VSRPFPAALAGLALAGAVIAGGRHEAVIVGALSVVFAASSAAAWAFRHPPLLLDWIEWIERHVGRRLGGLLHRATARVRDVAQSLDDVHPSVAAWSVVGALSAVNWLLDAVCLALCFRAVHEPVPWGAVLLAFAGAKVIGSIGITPGGLGLVEGGLVGTFVAYGTKAPAAAAGVLVYRAVTFGGLVGLGWGAAALLSVLARGGRGGRKVTR
jgi:uncharacterized membrane protein YbhN (UPF0104 family)